MGTEPFFLANSREERLKKHNLYNTTPSFNLQIVFVDEKNKVSDKSIQAGIFSDFTMFEILRAFGTFEDGSNPDIRMLGLTGCGLEQLTTVESVGYYQLIYRVFVKAHSSKVLEYFDILLQNLVRRDVLVAKEFDELRKVAIEVHGKSYADTFFNTKMKYVTFNTSFSTLPKALCRQSELINYVVELNDFLDRSMDKDGLTYKKGCWLCLPYIDYKDRYSGEYVLGILFFVDPYVKTKLITYLSDFFIDIYNRDFSEEGKPTIN